MTNIYMRALNAREGLGDLLIQASKKSPVAPADRNEMALWHSGLHFWWRVEPGTPGLAELRPLDLDRVTVSLAERVVCS
jgi:hypothetical protein